MSSAIECFWIALRLGLTSFGGPVAHIGYFREEYVQKRAWLSESHFAELMAMSQFIPGPGSSQLGAAIGYERAKFFGGFCAWLGFTLPSALLMFFVAWGLDAMSLGMIYGMKLVAVAVVASAWLGMKSSLAVGFRKKVISYTALLALYLFSAPWMPVLAIFIASVCGIFFLSSESSEQELGAKKWGIGGIIALLVFVVLLLISYNGALGRDWAALAGIYHAGALVFGGGHVVLPMLQEAMVPVYMEKEAFLGGYGATQAMPGPVFTFASFLGGRCALFGSSLMGAALATVAVFLPGMLLLTAVMSVWSRLRSRQWAQRAIQGANAAVVGVLGVALLKMLLPSQGVVSGWRDLLAVALCFVMIQRRTMPVYLLVLLAAGIGSFLWE